jgi:hypothetical protein
MADGHRSTLVATRPLNATELETRLLQMCCADPECGCGGRALANDACVTIGPVCHPGAGVVAHYQRAPRALLLTCVVCRTKIACLEVAAGEIH